MRKFLVIIILCVGVGTSSGTSHLLSSGNVSLWLAGVSFFPSGTTTSELRGNYEKNDTDDLPTVNVLIVPGHDQESWGAKEGSLKEVDLNIELAKYLYDFLSNEDRFSVTLTQDEDGYTNTFSSYFNENRTEIIEFMQEKRAVMKDAVSDGLVDSHNGVIHNRAASETSVKLYGMNKWANENDMDIVIHIHFNDDYNSYRGISKDNNGFAIYIPENQYSNSIVSGEVARYVFNRLKKMFPVSSLRQEKIGIVEDQGLIAIGSNNTLDSAGMLVEYGYIYENQFLDDDLRPIVLKELAFQTYKGLIDFFKIPNSTVADADTSLLPYLWEKDIKYKMKGSEDVLRMQSALVKDGVYPPEGTTLNDCPANGSFYGCTKSGILEFQKKYKIPETGYVDLMTKEKLNELYSK